MAADDQDPGPTRSRAERRRIAAAARKGLAIPDRLDTRRSGWDRRLVDVIDKVYVDGVCLGPCEAYNKISGFAKYRGIPQEVYGVVTVTQK